MTHPIFCLTAALLLCIQFHYFARAQNVAVNYGMVADNLPSSAQVINLCKSKSIQKVRLFDPNPDALRALQNSGIEVILGVKNNDLPALATDPASSAGWVQTNVVPYAGTVNFRCISAGNELVPSDLASSILPAMQAIEKALTDANLKIPVSTAVAQTILSASFPPSAGAWSPDAAPIIVPIVQYLQAKNYPLLCNVYPYFAYASDPVNVRLDYALMNTTEVIVTDGGLSYTNLLDAQVDAVYAAMEKVGANNVEIIVSETGWPSGGADIATITNAQTYNNNLIARVKANTGTPRRPGKLLQCYVFALFNEDLKAPGIEQHFGLFNPDMSEVYPINF